MKEVYLILIKGFDGYYEPYYVYGSLESMYEELKRTYRARNHGIDLVTPIGDFKLEECRKMNKIAGSNSWILSGGIKVKKVEVKL